MNKRLGPDAVRLRSTGTDELDLVLGGGLRKGSLIVIAGAPGTGKTILAQQICFHNATPEHKALYYTTLSESHAKLVEHLERFDFFDRSSLEERIDFLHVTDLISTRDGDGIGPVLAEVVKRSFETRASIVVIDSSKALHDFADEKRFERLSMTLPAASHTRTRFLSSSASTRPRSSKPRPSSRWRMASFGWPTSPMAPSTRAGYAC